MCNDGYKYECQDKCPYWGFCPQEIKGMEMVQRDCNRKTFYDWVIGGFDNMIISGGKAREILLIDCHEWFDLMKATGRKY